MSKINYRPAAEEFYRILFEKMPAMRRHFADREKQLNMFEIAMSSIASRSIDDPEMIKYIHLLGDYHKRRGITSVQMKVGRDAFVAGLDFLGEELTTEARKRQLTALRKLEEALGF